MTKTILTAILVMMMIVPVAIHAQEREGRDPLYYVVMDRRAIEEPIRLDDNNRKIGAYGPDTLSLRYDPAGMHILYLARIKMVEIPNPGNNREIGQLNGEIRGGSMAAMRDILGRADEIWLQNMDEIPSITGRVTVPIVEVVIVIGDESINLSDWMVEQETGVIYADRW